MTPKEKAEELVNKFIEHTKEWSEIDGYVIDKYRAKQCALITVDEIQEMLMLTRKRLDISDTKQLKFNDNEIVYSILWLDQVKQEINKL